MFDVSMNAFLVSLSRAPCSRSDGELKEGSEESSCGEDGGKASKSVWLSRNHLGTFQNFPAV